MRTRIMLERRSSVASDYIHVGKTFHKLHIHSDTMAYCGMVGVSAPLLRYGDTSSEMQIVEIDEGWMIPNGFACKACFPPNNEVEQA